MNILLVLLGCNVPHLLNDRVRTATQFANNNDNTNITWFLSGGIKNPSQDAETEAEKMGTQIAKHSTVSNNDWNYVYDKVATNTAENFIMVKKHLLETSNKYAQVFVITSGFHHSRAKKIAEQIIGEETDVQWILSGAELEDSRYWETIHIKNVDADVKNALEKYNM